MLVSEIKSRVRNIAGDTNALQFTDAMLIEWINAGIRQCALDNLLLQKSGTVNTVIGTGNVVLPSDIMKMYSVSYNGSQLKGMTLQEFESQFSDGAAEQSDPTIYYVWANVLNLYPVPSAVGTVKINYVRLPVAVVADADTPDLPVGYHDRLVDYCLAKVAEQDGDDNRYQIKMQEFSTGVAALKDHPEYDADLYPMMVTSDRDSGYDSIEYGWYYGG